MHFFACRHCRQQLSYQPKHAGQQCQCPQCAAWLTIPPTHGHAQQAETLPPAPQLPLEQETLPPSPAVNQPATIDPARPDTFTLPQGTFPAVPGYEILGELGRGGMGVVYKAKHLKLNRIVALKMILTGAHAGTTDLVRFLSEAEAVAAFQHANIVQVFDTGQHENLPYMALEFVEGGSLADRLKNAPLPARDAAKLVEDIARGMNAAHQAGIVHRDLKPDNVLLTQDGTPKVTDFGLAKRVQGGSGLTQTGVIMGTPSYMAPEQAGGEGKRVGPAADVYALGAILYASLTSRPPFQADNVMDTILQVMSQEPVPPRLLTPHVPKDLETICLKCMEKEPQKRYTSAHDLAEDLNDWQAGKPITARPVGRIERVWKWVRRHPAQTCLLVTVVALLLILVVGGPLAAWRQASLREVAETEKRRAKSSEELAKKKGAEAVTAAKTAKDESDRAKKIALEAKATLYAVHIQLAQSAWERNHVKRLREILTMYQTVRADEPDWRGWEWYYLWQQCHKELATFHNDVDGTGFAGFIVCSPDGTRLASATGFGQVKIWDLATRKLQKVLQVTKSKEALSIPAMIKCLAFSSDNNRLFIVHYEHIRDGLPVVQTWDLDKGKLLDLKKTTLAQGFSPISPYTLTLSPNGRRLAAKGKGVTFAVLDMPTDKVLPHVPKMFYPTSAMFDAKGERLAVVEANTNKVVVWDLLQGQLVQQFPQFSSSSVALSGNGKRLAWWDYQKQTLQVADVDKGQVLHSLSGHTDMVRGLAFTANGQLLASASLDKTVKLWDTRSGRLLGTFLGHTHEVDHVCFSPDGAYLFSSSRDNTVKIWPTMAGLPFRRLDTVKGGGETQRLALGPKGRHVVQVTGNTIRTWDLTLGTVRHEIKDAHQRRVLIDAAYHPDGKSFATTGHDELVRVWDSNTGEQLFQVRAPTGFDTGPFVTYQPKTNHMVVAMSRRIATPARIDLRGASGRNLIQRIVPPFPFLRFNNIMKLSPKQQQTVGLQIRRDQIEAVAASPDGRILATGHPDGNIHLWDAASAKHLRTLKGHKDVVHGLSFHPHKALLASGSWDTTVKIWDVHTGLLMMTLHGHSTGVNGVAFTPDGNRLASSNGGGVVKIFDTKRGRELLSLRGQLGKSTNVIANQLRNLTFSPDGKHLLAAGRGILVWDGRRLTTDVMIEKEARGLVTFYLEQGLPKPEIVRRIQNHRILEMEVRQQALALVNRAPVRDKN